MSLYPLGISRSRDVPGVGEQATVGQVALRWVLVHELAAALADAPEGPPEPLQHAAAVDAIHRRICVLPMRFGTVLCDEAEVRSVLQARRRELLERLDRLEGTCEMGLRIVLPRRQTPQANPLPGALSPTAYMEQRRAHYQREDALSEQAHPAVETVVRELEGTYRDWRGLTPSPPGLLRLAFLVERRRVGVFQRCLEASGAERREEQRTLLGPWPPYSFV